MSRLLRFQSGPAGRELLAWFAELQTDHGARARLRRAARPAETVFEPAYHRLLHRLLPPAEAERPDTQLAIAAVAGLAARVKEHVPTERLAAQMGMLRAGRSTPAVSEPRFRRLLALEDEDLEERYQQLARLVSLLDGRLDLRGLADAAVCWNLRARQQWAYDYYQAAPSSGLS